MENYIKEYLDKLRFEMKKKYNRVLPTNELLYDRWEKAKFLNCGEGTSIYDTSVIMGDVEIGKNVWVGPYTILEGINGKIKIGDFCHISSGVQIFTHNSVKYVLTSGQANFDKGDVIIGNNAYIGPATIIKHGVNIGNFCVIGANSFVNKNIPDYSIAFGTPIRIVGKIILKDGDIEFIYST
ncbi:Maltose O-acetyltransferase [Caloramator mitchellensis]|uniref:Maltose O-acetyltransferase n=1 Tax=Caloramator mitchellensis TaxID=908809 RepID=A0A0R3JU33_CALMK|nr:acyltransferase [Caloramator mitchellensis]KRQ85773.1 Maltose O-acetyltransferase [Caloramator mitchellensis]